jgi:hypothetical protein
MKKLLACLLLALPLSASAGHETGKQLNELFNVKGIIYSFCRWTGSIRKCYEVEAWGTGSKGNLIFEITIDGKTYRALPDACANNFICRDQFVTASKNLRRELERHFDDIEVGDQL